jgi:hypothetical protein
MEPPLIVNVFLKLLKSECPAGDIRDFSICSAIRKERIGLIELSRFEMIPT